MFVYTQGVAQSGGVGGAAGIWLHVVVAAVMMVVSLLVVTLKDHITEVIKNRSVNTATYIHEINTCWFGLMTLFFLSAVVKQTKI